MRVVAALGGNALLRRGETAEAEAQRRNLARAATTLAELALDHELVLTHGNGPQVGLLALQAEAYERVRPYPFDVLVAESEGMVGYMLDQTLGNLLPQRPIATLLTQVVVHESDPAFAHPTKPVGPVYSAKEATRLAAERGWSVAPDGSYWRRVVPSPQPQRIVELATIRLLVDAGVLVICGGGGGMPVTERQGVLRGVEAVIDKDLAASLLAAELGADALLLLTDVPGVQQQFGSPDARPIAEVTTDELRKMDLPAGSMRPKAEAACRFVERTGRLAVIAALDDAALALDGYAGTRVVTPTATAAAAPPGPRGSVRRRQPRRPELPSLG
ncbi:MAG TPA: carbamate kinase [Thermoleophilaceae bacterium]